MAINRWFPGVQETHPGLQGISRNCSNWLLEWGPGRTARSRCDWHQEPSLLGRGHTPQLRCLGHLEFKRGLESFEVIHPFLMTGLINPPESLWSVFWQSDIIHVWGFSENSSITLGGTCGPKFAQGFFARWNVTYIRTCPTEEHLLMSSFWSVPFRKYIQSEQHLPGRWKQQCVLGICSLFVIPSASCGCLSPPPAWKNIGSMTQPYLM